jgi:Fur family peroxide stress response transcriptional regulator
VEAQTIMRSLEDSGLRCTPQRFSVMSYLYEHHGHPTAAEIFEGVNRLDPRSSRATTYNNLRDLVQAGLVREVAVEGRSARFDVTGERHHHFICDTCGAVEDMDWYGKRVVHQVELIVRGLCSKCARRKPHAKV